MNKIGILDKIFFWKDKKKPLEPVKPLDLGGLGKESDPGLDKDISSGGIPPKPETSKPYPGMPSHESPSQYPLPPEEPASAASSFEQSRSSQPQISMQDSLEKDMQVLTAKLDSLKALLDNINQRLANIERIANESQKEEYQYQY
ncbi:hypothetical protein GF361_05430 [Candidatus Woesearchaeota archaeon]|nr:hypothetical protein [Candidatus Woesearchaeota archaeon]